MYQCRSFQAVKDNPSVLDQLNSIKQRANQIEERVSKSQRAMTISTPILTEQIESVEQEVKEKLNQCSQEAENVELYMDSVEKYKKAKSQMSGFLRRGTDHLFRMTQLPASKKELQEALQKTKVSKN